MNHYDATVNFADMRDADAFVQSLLSSALFSLGGYTLNGNSGFMTGEKITVTQNVTTAGSGETLAEISVTGFFPTYDHAAIALSGLMARCPPHRGLGSYSVRVEIGKPVPVNGARLP